MINKGSRQGRLVKIGVVVGLQEELLGVCKQIRHIGMLSPTTIVATGTSSILLRLGRRAFKFDRGRRPCLAIAYDLVLEAHRF